MGKNLRRVNFSNGGDLTGGVSTDAEQVCELKQFGFAIHGRASDMMHVNSRTGPRVSLEGWRMDAMTRIDSQAAIVARLVPGTEDHRTATSVLLLLQDSLFVLSQTNMLLRAAREQTRQRSGQGTGAG